MAGTASPAVTHWVMEAVETGGGAPGRPLTCAAAEAGRIDVLVWLTSHGAHDVRTPDASGRTPLWNAMRRGHVETMTWLAEHGAAADVRTPTAQGKTPMHGAAARGHVEVMAWLADRGGGADVRVPDAEGATPLWAAARGGHVEAMAWLADHGAGDDVCGAAHPLFPSPMAVARTLDTVAWLLTHGAGDDVDDIWPGLAPSRGTPLRDAPSEPENWQTLAHTNPRGMWEAAIREGGPRGHCHVDGDGADPHVGVAGVDPRRYHTPRFIVSYTCRTFGLPAYGISTDIFG